MNNEFLSENYGGMKKIRIIARFLLIVILLVHAGCMSTDSNARGGMAGSVTDSYGNPLSGVKIATNDSSTYSDANGKWALAALPAQTTEVTASREKYQAQSKTLEVLSGETLSNVVFSLPADGDIYDIQVSAVTSTSARIIFYSKMATKAQIKYGINALLDQTTVVDNAELFLHQYELTSLTPASTYRFKCVAVDAMGRTLESEVRTFNTEFTLRPEAPAGLTLSKVANSNMIQLAWDQIAGADFAGFKVYRARNKQGPFDVVGTVNLNGYSDSDVTPGVKYYYRVTRIAGTGVESSPTTVESLLMPGVMSQNAVWTAQEAPYHLTGDLVVAPGVSLMIDKGVGVTVRRGNQWENTDVTDLIDLMVQGTLVIQGTADQPVTFTSIEGSPVAGDWNGMNFDVMSDLGASMIKGLKLSFAEIGISGLSGLPRITDSQFYSCRQSGVQCYSARGAVLLQNLLVDTCASGLLVRDNNVTVQILDNNVSRCLYGIVCRDNKYAEVERNRISFSSITGIDAGNDDQASRVRFNLVGYGSSGTGIVCRGNDEIRRNTLHANIGIDVKDTARAILRSNLLLTEQAKNGAGVLFSGAVAYDPNTSANLLTIQNNAVWNLALANRKYANSDGTALPASSDLPISVNTGPALQGGDPFLEFPSLSYSYTPSPDSVLKGAGYDFEDIGAEDVPD